MIVWLKGVIDQWNQIIFSSFHILSILFKEDCFSWGMLKDSGARDEPNQCGFIGEWGCGNVQKKRPLIAPIFKSIKLATYA